MIKATRFFFFDVDTSNCKAMISMIKATRFFLGWGGVMELSCRRGQLKCDGTRVEKRFRLSATWTNESA